MGHTSNCLDSIRTDIAADDDVLKEARARLLLVRNISGRFDGALRTFGSGSLEHHTFNHPVGDGDGGVVLNRVCYPSLGPDGNDEVPNDITEDLRVFLGSELRETYPNAWVTTSKRGPKAYFGQPLGKKGVSQDPTVDLVVAMTRRGQSGLWIPNLEKQRWEVSDPEKHCELFNGGTVAMAALRRKVIRLLKAWNRQYFAPGLSSFHLSTLAYNHVESGMSVATALQTVFDQAATFLATGYNTPDPAGVSPNLRLLQPRDAVVRRLRAAADALADALAHDDDPDAVQSALHRVFWKYVDKPAGDALATAAAAVRGPGTTTGALGLGGASLLVPSRAAYGTGPR